MGKRTWRVLSILVGTLLLAGCSATGEKGAHLSPKNPVDITMWHYYNGAQAIAMEDLVKEFNNTVGKEKGITVTAVGKGNIDDLATALADAEASKAGADPFPDIFQGYVDTAIQYDKKDMIVNLNDYVDADTKAQYVTSYIDEGCFGEENEWKLFPIAKSTEVMMLNKTDWNKFAEESNHTIDELSTWEGLASVSADYYEWSGGKSFFGRDAYANYVLVGCAQLGHDIFQVENEKVKLDFDQQTMKRIWDNFYIPFVKGYYTQQGRYRSDDMKIGKIVAMVCASTGASYFPKEISSETEGTYPIEYEILSIPNFEGTESYAVQQGAGMAVTKSTKEKEYASVLFLEWLTESENNKKFVLEADYLPVRMEDNSAESLELYQKDHALNMDSISIDTTKTALDTTQNSKLYYMHEFDNSYNARNLLGNGLIDQAVEDYQSIQNAVEAGADREQELEKYTSEEYFTEWYNQMKTTLGNIVEQ